MSVDTFIYVGWYVQATTKTIDACYYDHVCSVNERHFAVRNAKFCPECGAPVTSVKRDLTSHKTLTSLLWEMGDEEWHDLVDPVDRKWLGEHFNALPNYNIGVDEDNIEIVVFHDEKYTRQYDGGYGRCVDFSTPFEQPPQEMIDRLTSIMEYEDVKLVYGMVVSVS